MYLILFFFLFCHTNPDLKREARIKRQAIKERRKKSATQNEDSSFEEKAELEPLEKAEMNVTSTSVNSPSSEAEDPLTLPSRTLRESSVKIATSSTPHPRQDCSEPLVSLGNHLYSNFREWCSKLTHVISEILTVDDSSISG